MNLTDYDLTPYTVDNASLVQLPWEVRDGATCPGIHQFLMDVFEADEGMTNFFYEIAGYTCLSRNVLRKAILIYGPGNNGKSIIMHLLTRLLGLDNVAAIPLQRLGGDDRFAPSHLVGKLANICGDVGPNSARDMSLFKQLTGGDPIYAERKGQDGFEFYSGAVPVFSANEFPRSPDTTSAYINRWLVLELDRVFADNADTEAELKALGSDQAEMEGFLLQALAGAKRVLDSGTFTLPAKVTRATAKYARAIDGVRSWLHDECQAGEGYELHKQNAFSFYVKYCEYNRAHPLGRNKFYERVRSAGYGEGKSATGEHVFKGVRITPLDEVGPEDRPVEYGPPGKVAADAWPHG